MSTRHSPAQIDAEQAVLGGMMLSDDGYWRISDMLTVDDFATDANRKIFSAIERLCKLGSPVDAVTMADIMADDGVDPVYVMQMANNTPSAANICAYAAIVRDRSIVRKVSVAGSKIMALRGSDALMEAQKIIRTIEVCERTVKTSKQVLHDITESLSCRMQEDKKLIGISTGIPKLDEMTCGLKAGELVIIAGRPSMGKSLFAAQIATHAAMCGNSVHIATLEMSSNDLMLRMVSMVSGLPIKLLMNPRGMTQVQWGQYTETSAMLAHMSITMDQDANTLDAICARIRQQALAGYLDLVVIDYLGYMRLPKAENQALAVQECTRALKQLAKELKIPLLLVCQLNREVGNRSDKRPVLTDLRDSGAIEQDADVVILLHREDYYNKGTYLDGYAEAIIEKQRNGETGSVPLRHKFDVMCFEPVDALPKNVVEFVTQKPRKKLADFA